MRRIMEFLPIGENLEGIRVSERNEGAVSLADDLASSSNIKHKDVRRQSSTPEISKVSCRYSISRNINNNVYGAVRHIFVGNFQSYIHPLPCSHKILVGALSQLVLIGEVKRLYTCGETDF